MKSQLCNPESSGRAWHWLLYLRFQHLPRWQVDPELWEMLLTGLQDQSGRTARRAAELLGRGAVGAARPSALLQKEKKANPEKLIKETEMPVSAGSSQLSTR